MIVLLTPSKFVKTPVKAPKFSKIKRFTRIKSIDFFYNCLFYYTNPFTYLAERQHQNLHHPGKERYKFKRN